MTIENDFLVFAGAAAANVESQASYLIDPALSNGVSSGTASSALANKVWRQSSVISAMIADFIVQQSGQPAIDDGTTMTLLANFIGALGVTGRLKLVAPLTLYVSQAGNDLNSGLAATAPFATLQRAWNAIANGYDLAGYPVTVNVADGTYTQGVVCTGMPSGLSNTAPTTGNPANCISFVGNPGSPSRVVVTAANSNCFSAVSNSKIVVSGFQLQATGTNASYQNLGSGLYAADNGGIMFSNILFGACEQHIYPANGGFISSNAAPYSIIAGGGGILNSVRNPI